MFEALAQALAAGLSIWESKEKTKYVDQLIQLKKDYYDEFNKPMDHRSDAVLDNLESQLRGIAIAFAAGVGTQNASVKP